MLVAKSLRVFYSVLGVEAERELKETWQKRRQKREKGV
jgi:hypothetical protein